MKHVLELSEPELSLIKEALLFYRQTVGDSACRAYADKNHELEEYYTHLFIACKSLLDSLSHED